MKRRSSTVTRRNLLIGLLFISPWLFGFLIFTVYPMVASLFFSFTNYSLLKAPKFVGLANFVQMLTMDKLFWRAVQNTLYFAVFSVPLNIFVSVGIALLLNMKVRAMAFYRTIYFLPSIVPTVASALLWLWILNPQFGLANAILRQMGIPTVGWLTDPAWAKPSIITMGVWGIGGSMVIYLAALQDVDVSLYEAAELDGAGSWAKTWAITIPMITPTIFFNLVLGMIDVFQSFTAIFVLTQGNGGPLDSTLVYGLLLYRNAFSYLKMGYASAMAWAMFVIIVAVTFTIFKSSGRWVYYAGEVRQ